MATVASPALRLPWPTSPTLLTACVVTRDPTSVSAAFLPSRSRDKSISSGGGAPNAAFPARAPRAATVRHSLQRYRPPPRLSAIASAAISCVFVYRARWAVVRGGLATGQLSAPAPPLFTHVHTAPCIHVYSRRWRCERLEIELLA